jgi:hypothetical protein
MEGERKVERIGMEEQDHALLLHHSHVGWGEGSVEEVGGVDA